MLYLSRFQFPNYDREYKFRLEMKKTCYDSMYPFFVLSGRGLTQLDFEPITILYGGNGSGKTTALNVMAEKLHLQRDALYNRSPFFENYAGMCRCVTERSVPAHSRFIASDDVFDYMLNVRSLNGGIHRRREELFEEYTEAKYARFRVNSLDDYEELKKVCLARSKTQSEYVRRNLACGIRERSNGESAFGYFTEKITDGGLYLLDEPENSLSPERQQELVVFLRDSARFFGCQFIIATHSPFLLSLPGAKIYDLDADPADVKKWTELANVRAYYEFFKRHEKQFEE